MVATLARERTRETELTSPHRAAAAAQTVIEARGLEKIYGSGASRVEALAGVSLNVKAGEWVSLIGPSGSGKSTLMNLLGLLDRPTGGFYALDAHEVSSLKGGELARARRERVGFVFQSYNLLPGESALANVELPLMYTSVGGQERQERATAALERVGLANRLKHRPTELSGGQKQRVAIARALVSEPSLLLADEPTGNLDTKTTDEIMNLFAELHAAGVTLLVVTHEPEVAERGERTVEIRDGTIFGDTGRRGKQEVGSRR